MSDFSQESNEFEKNASFDILFKDKPNPDKILPVIRQCVLVSKNESEIIRAVEIALCTCIQNYPVDNLEDLFRFVCPAGASAFVNKIKYLEEKSNPIIEECNATFDFCLKIVSYFQSAFQYLNEVEKVTISRVESLLTCSLEMLLKCFSHCKGSEEVYGGIFNSLTDCLSGFFKKCCSLLDHLLDYLTEKSVLDLESEKEITLLDGLLNRVSKCGVVMVNLEVKTMAKIWKTYVYLLEKYLCVLKMKHRISETIRALCDVIVTNIGGFKNEDVKLLKLSCFLLKLVMKLCEIFNGELSRCHGALFNLLLMLCKCEGGLLNEKNLNENVLSQLSIGVDPLLSFLLSDREMVREFASCEGVEKCEEFCLLCCLLLKKLSHSNASVRCLWINESDNIFDWIFKSASTSAFVGFSPVRLPKILINWQQVTFTDLYEYVLVTCSAFFITVSADEFVIVEKTLLRNVLQPNLVPALLAMDIWCFLARIGDSELCYTQILTLSELYRKIHHTSRVEKIFLATLIRRLFRFLTDTQRKEYLKCFPPSFLSSIWDTRTVNCIPRENVCDVIRPLVSRFCHLLRKTEWKVAGTATGNEHAIYMTFGGEILDSWKFNPDLLPSNTETVHFLKLTCGLLACVAPFLTPEQLFTVLSQMKKLLSSRAQSTEVKIYFLWVLNALSAVTIPPGPKQATIIATVGEIFRELLSSKQILAKQKALEVFESFTRVTTHEEVIAMTVHNSPQLKMEVLTYLKKEPGDRAPDNVDEYLRGLFTLKYEHVCEKKEPKPGISTKRIKLDIPDLEGIIVRFREDGNVILDHFKSLSEVQKKEIKSTCSSILSIIQ